MPRNQDQILAFGSPAVHARSWPRIAAATLIGILLILGWRSHPTSAQGVASVLTQHNDNSRTGANLNETVLTTANVNVNQFGMLFSRSVDGQVYAQPLYVPGVTVGQTVHNVVYVATMKNNVYAFDADDPSASTALWQVNLGPAVPVADVGETQDIDEVIGITGTPVIDSATGILYCVAKTKESGSYFQRLHALDITSGQEKLGGPVVVDASASGIGDDSVGGVIRFNALRHLNRPALLLANGFVYLAFGSHGDQRPYHGWVLTYDAATLQPVASSNVSPSGWGGGIWSSGQGLAADQGGYVYFMTANGTFNMNVGGASCSSCFVKLSTPSLSLVDWFAPYNQIDLNANNFELNSSGPLLLPGFNRLVGGGKEGKLYVLDRGRMGHFQAGSNSQIVQELQITYGDHLHGSPIYWESPVQGPLVYVWYEQSHLEAFKLVNGLFQKNIDPNTGLLVPATQSTMGVPPGMPGGVLSLSANGTTAGSGVVWATTPYNANAQPATVAGIFRAFDASDLSIELWDSKQNAARDDAGNFAKFTPPTIANGKVYLATFSNQLVVYGLLGSSPPVPAPAVSSVSPASGPTSGGTAVTITGANFASGATVTMGGSAATLVNVVNSTRITATTPAHAAGAVNVTVTNPDARSGTLAGGFTYTALGAAPTVSSVAPSSGPTTGGTAVTITGSNFAAGATVSIGGSAATGVSVVNSTTITATTPAHTAGAVNVTVTNPDAQSGTLANGFTYTTSAPAPTVRSIAPASGPTVGGTPVTITGTNFAAGATVSLGGSAATNVSVISSTTITATTPAHAAGAVNVTVTNPDTQSGTLANGFTYISAGGIGFVQVASATPQSPSGTVQVPYSSAQAAGDLNVVVVGWNDTTATVQSVRDSAGNAYNLAIGATSGTGLRESIYYATNIIGGNDTVTVTFSQPAIYPDVRILEYRGVGTLDVTSGASGSGTVCNSGSKTTTAPNVLIVGANIVSTDTRAAGTGFTSRIITYIDSDIAEDRIVSAPGTYSATATLGTSGNWVMQMVTFK